MKPNCLNPLLFPLAVGLILFRGLLFVLLTVAISAHASDIVSGTIDFGAADSHASFGDVTTPYNGLTFNGQWQYFTYTDLYSINSGINRSGDAITPKSAGGDAIIKSANGTDRFSLTGLAIVAYGSGMTTITFQGYRSGVLGPTETVNTTLAMKDNFIPVTLTNMVNVDQIVVTNNSPSEGNFLAFDNLIVAAYSAPLSLSPASLTNPAVSSAYSQTISASGGNGTYSYAVTAGSLPAGLSLNTSTGALTGTPTAGGAFNFTITATDTASATGSKAYSITVAAPTISFSPATLTAGTVGSAYSQSISGSGGTAPYGSYIVKTGALPAGLSLSSGGVVSGTPTAGGTFTFTVQGTDSSTGSGPYSATSSTISLTIGAPTLSFTPTTLTGGTVGAAYSQSISGSGGTAPYGSFTLASGSLPPGLSLGSGGTLSGTPTAAGTYTFTVSAQDSSTGSGPYSGTSSTISLTIGAPTLSLSPAAGALTAAARGSAYSQTFSTSGGTSPYTYSITAGSLPAGLTLSSGGILSGTPTAEGGFSFTVTATDSSGGTQYSTSQAYSLTVNPPLPVANAVSATVAFNSSNNAITLNITGGTASSVAVASAASHGTATASGTSITYTPTAGYSGSDSFTYTATNASGTSAAATVSITVNPAPPVANAVSATVAYNSSNNAITLNITGGAAASVAVASAASHGTATASGTSITYTPTAGYIGSDSFTYTATNAAGTSAAATVTITVNPLAPVANAVSATVAYNSSNNAITLNITGGVATSVAVASAASHGTATASGTSITYTPTAGYSGSDSFTYTATNATGTSAAATVTITVNPQAPVANAVSLTVSYNSAANAVTLNITGGAATSVAVAGAASHGIATASGTSITYTPTSGYAGSDSFTYTATNAGGTSAAATVSVTVNPQAPVANPVSVTVAFNSSNNAIPLSISGGAATSVAVASGASHGTATASGTSITYTPTAGYTGSDSFTYTATNVTGTSAAATVTITVSAAAPVANAVSATVAFNSSANPITLNITGGVATSVAVATAAAHGMATASGTSITYTPQTGYAGSDSFTYRATNATGTSAPATVSITVNPAAPVAGAVTVTVPINSSNNPIPLNVSGGAAATVTVVSAAGHGTATASGASITYTPTAGYSGSDSFTYTATNATGTSAPATVSISVMTRPDPSKDANVVGIIGAQTEVAKRFSLTQISNFQSRLENLHVRLRPERPRGFDSPNARRPSVMPALAVLGNNSGPAAANSDQSGGFGLATGTAVTNLGSRDAATGNGTGTGGVATAGPVPGQESGFNPFAALSTLGQMANSHGLPTLNISSKASNFQDTGFDVWSAGNVSFGRMGDADAKFTTSGISFGTDSRFGDNLILGLGVGFGHERQKIGNDGTRNVGDDYSVIAYGSYQPMPGTFIDALIGMGRLDLESRRYSAAAGAIATSQRTGKQWFASLSAAYEFQQDTHILSPYGRIDIASTRLDAAVESGVGIYNLAYFSQQVPVTKLSFGLRGETSVELESALARPYFRVEYQHDFENPEGARMAYADDLSGPSYQIAATTLKRDTMVFGLGSDFVFKSAWTLGLRYQYSNNSGAMTMHTLGLQVRKSF